MRSAVPTVLLLGLATATQAGEPAPVFPLARGALQRCLGIVPGSDRMPHPALDSPACKELPGASLFAQAGERFKAGDKAGAARLAEQAAEAGNALAQLRVAMLFGMGDGVPKDLSRARGWYARAAAQGEPGAQAELGYYDEQAMAGPENWDRAARLWEASARQGWMKGQFALGRAYQFGIGVPQDRAQAIVWFRRSAAQGNAQADYYAKWLASPTNNVGFRDDAEHDLVIQGRLRFGLGAADPAGITFHGSAQRNAWLRGLAADLNASEAQVHWNIRKREYDDCQRSHGENCRPPGPPPR